METFCPSAPKLNGILSGCTVLQRTMTRLGYHHEGFRLLIPSQLGAEIENELLRTDPQEWAPFTDGVQVHAEGTLKQLLIVNSIWIGWKCPPRRKRKELAPC